MLLAEWFRYRSEPAFPVGGPLWELGGEHRVQCSALRNGRDSPERSSQPCRPSGFDKSPTLTPRLLTCPVPLLCSVGCPALADGIAPTPANPGREAPSVRPIWLSLGLLVEHRWCVKAIRGASIKVSGTFRPTSVRGGHSLASHHADHSQLFDSADQRFLTPFLPSGPP